MDESTSLPLLRSLAEFPKSLIGQKQHKALPKGLSEKGFTVEKTEKEEQSLELFLDDQLSALSTVRVTTQKSLSMGAWKEDMGLVEVTDHRGGHWKTHGHTHLGNLLLQPEEALFLMECGSLEVCTDGAVPMSIQQAYHTMLSDMDPVQYQVYASLKRLGYAVFRVQLLRSEKQKSVCSGWQDVGQGMVPREAGGGGVEGEGREYVGGDREEGGGRGGGEGGRGNRGRDKGGGEREEGGNAHTSCTVETVSCCPLCTSVSSTSRIQMLEVYQPRNHFRKTDPGPPQFRVIVASPTDPFPPPTLVQQLEEVTPRAPVKFCVVDGASTAYYSLTHAAIAPLQTAQI